ncbi:hypothetical protein ACFV4K_22690 [Nocardia sp. NPDC059764]|uniref:hypothetical protein n=1 Tax=Nocardia sp. NPDC059764 TaxID=3346939 RepID=UPI0036662B52
MARSKNEGPRQVELIGPYAGVFTYTTGAALTLIGPILGLTGYGWADGLCASVFTFPIGLGLVASTYEWRRTGRRFQTVGVPGIGEVLSVNEIHPGGENPDTADLTIRITGPTLDPFTADCTLDNHSGLTRGHTFDLMVDPTDNSFAIGFDHLFPQGDDKETPLKD